MKTVYKNTYEISKKEMINDYRNYINERNWDNCSEEVEEFEYFDNVVDMGNYYLIEVWELRDECYDGYGYDVIKTSVPSYEWNNERKFYFF